ncbi:hypothetical protein DSECCO2_260640 [anaerobic digester metagenome]|jgi:hypothetical protein
MDELPRFEVTAFGDERAGASVAAGASSLPLKYHKNRVFHRTPEQEGSASKSEPKSTPRKYPTPGFPAWTGYWNECF